MELPFKCNHEICENIFREHYKNRISHEFIRSSLGLTDSVRLKLNGTFKRWIYLLDENGCIFRIHYRVQTAIWLNEITGKWQYVSIFPNFIKKYCRPCLNMLEYISCQLGKGENVFRHIDDPEGLLDCEDSIVKPIRRIEKECLESNYPALLNSKYTYIYNIPLTVSDKKFTGTRRFSVLHNLVLTARQFFGREQGLLSLVNSIITI